MCLRMQLADNVTAHALSLNLQWPLDTDLLFGLFGHNCCVSPSIESIDRLVGVSTSLTFGRTYASSNATRVASGALFASVKQSSTLIMPSSMTRCRINEYVPKTLEKSISNSTNWLSHLLVKYLEWLINWIFNCSAALIGDPIGQWNVCKLRYVSSTGVQWNHWPHRWPAHSATSWTRRIRGHVTWMIRLREFWREFEIGFESACTCEWSYK